MLGSATLLQQAFCRQSNLNFTSKTLRVRGSTVYTVYTYSDLHAPVHIPPIILCFRLSLSCILLFFFQLFKCHLSRKLT